MRITDIQRFCMHDGPGIRTTVFLKGCPLRCAWCHNPETQSPHPEWLRYREKCIGCGACAASEQAVCPTKARELVGKEMTVEALFKEIEKDRAFYGENGGVTFSGGECMMQVEELSEILKLCKAHGIRTAIDTSGYVPFAHFETVLPDTDLFLYDIKCMDPARHRQYVGVDNERILENLARLLDGGAAVWVRVPIVPTVNDSEDEMRRICVFLAEHRPPQKVELLPYHAMGEAKYRALDKTAPVFDVPREDTMQTLRDIFQ